jgi:hypothetical protein
MAIQAVDVSNQNPSLVRQSLKTAIDELPEPVLFTVFEFLSFEKQRFHAHAQGNEMRGISQKKAAFERLKKYSGTVHLEKHWKAELCEALDEKYNRPR